MSPRAWYKSFKAWLNKRIVRLLSFFVLQIINGHYRVWGDKRRLNVHSTVNVVNTLFNTASGSITIGEYTFTGHNVSIITGTHRCSSFLAARTRDIPSAGNDIVIGRGVWIGSNAVILGPCQIGDHAVVAAGAVVLAGTIIPEYAIFAGVPARCIKMIVERAGDTEGG